MTKQKTRRAVGAAHDFVEIAFILFIAFVIGNGWWMSEGRAPVVFADAGEISVSGAVPGGVATVHMPVHVRRTCMMDRMTRILRQGEAVDLKEVQHFIPDPGPAGRDNPDFRFTMNVPAGLDAGPAVVAWEIDWNCGLRTVRQTSPLVEFDIG